MPASQPSNALQMLRTRYPSLPEAEVARVIKQAEETARRVVGQDDPELAFDLAQLRLDVRTQRTL